MMQPDVKSIYDIAIAGGGPAGILCALLLAHKNVNPLLITKVPAPQPGRTVALMQPSLGLLHQVGLKEQILAHAAPLRAIRIIDATERLIRAPTVTFEAKELQLEAFGLNIENDVLQQILMEAWKAFAGKTIFGTINKIEHRENSIQLEGEDFSINAQLVIAADGRRSLLRQAAGIKTELKSHTQSALTVLVNHSEPHLSISTEFHTRHGPMTFVPVLGNRSSLVMVTEPGEARDLLALGEDEFCYDLQRRCHHFLGRFSLDGARAVWPLETALPERFAAKRVMLVGEAAHVLPPIGAQGLNLGFRDAAAAAYYAHNAIEKGIDPGETTVLAQYDSARRQDVRLRSLAVDAFNSSLLAPYLPVHILRGIGLFAAQKSRFVRKRLMRAGLGPEQARIG